MPRDRTKDALLLSGALLLIVGLVSALSAVLVGGDDSFSMLFTTPALLLAAISLTIWPASITDSPVASASAIVAAGAPFVSVILWISNLPIAVMTVQILGAVAAVVAAVTITAGMRARGILIALIALLIIGMLAAAGAAAWTDPLVGRIGAGVAALAAILLGCVLSAAAAMRGTNDDIPPTAHEAVTPGTHR